MRVILAQRNLAALALVAPREHDDFVAFANLVHGLCPYKTSGASDTIFMNFSVRSSRVTGPKMRVPIGSSLALSKHSRIAIELHEGAVAAANALGGAHHDRAVDLAFLDATTRSRLFDAHLDDISNAGVAPLRSAQHLDAQDGLRAGVVGDFQSGFSLDHFNIPNLHLQGSPVVAHRSTQQVSLGPVVHSVNHSRCIRLWAETTKRPAFTGEACDYATVILAGQPGSCKYSWASCRNAAGLRVPAGLLGNDLARFAAPPPPPAAHPGTAAGSAVPARPRHSGHIHGAPRSGPCPRSDPARAALSRRACPAPDPARP
jgi:hypothetical protein